MFKNDFDVEEGKHFLTASADTIISQCQSQTPDFIVNIIYENVDNMLHCTAKPKERKVPPHNDKMKECDDMFMNLGVIIDSELKFEEHMSAKIKKANSIFGLIRRSFSFLDCKLFKKIVCAPTPCGMGTSSNKTCEYYRKCPKTRNETR